MSGEWAALVTALCWSLCAISFEIAGRRIGSLAVNVLRLALALLLLSLYGWAARGLPVPTDATPRTWLWLLLSGLVGFFLGDLFLFRAYLLIGVRRASLIMSLWPGMVALLAWLALGERLTARGLAGMALTLAGVAWVVCEQRPPDVRRGHGSARQGFAFAVLGATGQAVGMVLSKLGMLAGADGAYDPVAATWIRATAGLGAFLLLVTVWRRWPAIAAALRQRAAMGFLAAGTFLGPFAGVALSLYAVQHAKSGVAATIMSITPVLIIPLVVILHRERVSLRSILGAMVAVAGVALLFR